MEYANLLHEWRRITHALCIEQDMTQPEIAAALDYEVGHFRQILGGFEQPKDADRITAVLRELRDPFDDERLVRKQVKENGKRCPTLN